MKITRNYLRKVICEVTLTEFRMSGDNDSGALGRNRETSVPPPVIQKATHYRMDGHDEEVSLESNRDYRNYVG